MSLKCPLLSSLTSMHITLAKRPDFYKTFHTQKNFRKHCNSSSLLSLFDLTYFFLLLKSFLALLGLWGLLEGPLGALALTSGLISLAILITGLVQLSVQWANSRIFGVCQNNSAKAKADGGWDQRKNEKVSKCFCIIVCLKRDEISKSI